MLIDSLHISFDSFNFESILPMLVLVCGGIFTLLINAFTSRFSRNLNVFLCMLFLVLDFLVVLGLEDQENAFFWVFELGYSLAHLSKHCLDFSLLAHFLSPFKRALQRISNR